MKLVAVALIGITIVGCGSATESSEPRTENSEPQRSESTSKASSEYVTVLAGFRDAVRSNATYDAYGYGEYLPSTQRAAIHAFCFVADELVLPEATDLEVRSHMFKYIARKAKSDLRSERGIVATRPTHKAIRKLLAILGLNALNYEVAKPYVKACY